MVNICGDNVPSGWVAVKNLGTCARIATTSYLGRTIQKISGSASQKVTQSLVSNDVEQLTPPSDRKKLRKTAFDFNLDGKADLGVLREGGLLLLKDDSSNSPRVVPLGHDAGKIVFADFDGDGRTDFTVFGEAPKNPEEEIFDILTSGGKPIRTGLFGRNGDIPLAGDWDGDGRADLTFFRPGTVSNPQSTFFYRLSGDEGAEVHSVSLGMIGDKPVLGDYDGDGKTDAAIFRPSSAAWLVRQSRNEELQTVTFGLAGDAPVVGDYDNDGRTDQAVFRAGSWLINCSKEGLRVVNLGMETDIPVPADYDGDGSTDVAIFREGNWFVWNSSNGLFQTVNFGLAGDKPVPAAFIPR